MNTKTSKKKRKRTMKSMVSKPLRNSFQQAKIEFQNQNTAMRINTIISFVLCGYWMINSGLGLYIILKYSELQVTHPNIYLYLEVFSGKWIIAFFASLAFILMYCCVLKFFCNIEEVFHNTIGAFPVIYLLVILVSYMYSLYYGIVIIKEIYAPYDMNDYDYKFSDEQESLLLKVFVFNEVLVGAYILISFIYQLCCSGLRKSEHLIEIEGPGFEFTEDEVQRYKNELNESRKRTESLRKGQSFQLNHEKDINAIREDFIRSQRMSQQLHMESIRSRSASHDPYGYELKSLSVLKDGKNVGSPDQQQNELSQISPVQRSVSSQAQNYQTGNSPLKNQQFLNSPLKNQSNQISHNDLTTLKNTTNVKTPAETSQIVQGYESAFNQSSIIQQQQNQQQMLNLKVENAFNQEDQI